MVEVAPGTAGRDEAMSLAHCMTTLADGSVDPERVDLFPLSGLAHSEVEEFEGVWDSIEPRRRRTILSTMADKARDNIQFDFSSIFLTCLRDADEDVRLLSIHGLGEYEDRSALAPLIDMLRADESPRVRAAAAEALGRFSNLAQEGKLLSRDGRRVKDVFIETLADEETEEPVRRRALENVAFFNDGDVRALIVNNYNLGSVAMRRSAIVAMGHNGAEEWLDTILGELSSVRDDMRVEAAKALGELGEEAAVPHLVGLVEEDEALDVQVSAIEALGRIGGQAAKRALQQVLESGDAPLQEASEEALRQIAFEDSPLGPAG